MKIVFKDVNKKYSDKAVLHDLSFSINLENHSVFGIVGPNGAGKSTLMRLLSGITVEESGKIQVVLDDSKNKKNYASWVRQNSYYVPAGDRGLRNKLTIKDNLIYFSTLRGENTSERLQSMRELSQKFDASDLIDVQFDHLSTGQKKKGTLLVAMAIANKILLLDEPSSGLDIDSQKELKDIIIRSKNIENNTIIISSHDPSLLSGVVDEYIFIKKGYLIKLINHKLSEDEFQKEYSRLYNGEE